jgi:hypothetical protein
VWCGWASGSELWWEDKATEDNKEWYKKMDRWEKVVADLKGQ